MLIKTSKRDCLSVSPARKQHSHHHTLGSHQANPAECGVSLESGCQVSNLPTSFGRSVLVQIKKAVAVARRHLRSGSSLTQPLLKFYIFALFWISFIWMWKQKFSKRIVEWVLLKLDLWLQWLPGNSAVFIVSYEKSTDTCPICEAGREDFEPK